MFEKSAAHIFGGGRGNGDLETVLAGIAGAGNDAGDVVKIGFGHVHEAHGGDIGPEFGQNAFGAGALQRDQRAVSRAR